MALQSMTFQQAQNSCLNELFNRSSVPPEPPFAPNINNNANIILNVEPIQNNTNTPPRCLNFISDYDEDNDEYSVLNRNGETANVRPYVMITDKNNCGRFELNENGNICIHASRQLDLENGEPSPCFIENTGSCDVFCEFSSTNEGEPNRFEQSRIRWNWIAQNQMRPQEINELKTRWANYDAQIILLNRCIIDKMNDIRNGFNNLMPVVGKDGFTKNDMLSGYNTMPVVDINGFTREQMLNGL